MSTESRHRRVKLKPQDPFDLIRLLARSQSDPRKAIAELVQNSLDAGAKHVEIAWFNEKGQRAIRIWDDGQGVFPELPREEALERIARTIGHSHKRDLSPAERREQMVLGRYGIGLIGFWSVGHVMVIKSRVGGEPAWSLRLVEDKPTAEVAPLRARRLEDEGTWTEITILDVHPASQSKIRPPRLQAYLAGELRGQLLERDASITIRDRVARGKARKLFQVKAVPYLGQPLRQWDKVPVLGFEDARVELYLVGPDESRHGTVVLSCGGTTVLDDLALIDGDDAPRAPWSAGRLEGVIDFPDFSVAPSTRRGLVHNEPLDAFLAALPGLEAELQAHLATEAERRATEHRESLAKDIRRVFRSVAQMLPEYELFQVQGSKAAGAREGGAGAAAASATESLEKAAVDNSPGAPLDIDVGAAPATSTTQNAEGPPAEPAESPSLFPPGPLASLRLEPARLRVPHLGTRGLRARGLDADGRVVRAPLSFAWQLVGEGELEPEGAQCRYTAPDVDQRSEAQPPTRIRCEATEVAEDGTVVTASAEATVVLVANAGAERDTQGIPEPVAVHAPTEPWRSRMRDGRWEFNEGHRDYRAACETEARRLRYLVHLFAKEVVLRNFGRPGDGDILERMVEILSCLETRRSEPRS